MAYKRVHRIDYSLLNGMAVGSRDQLIDRLSNDPTLKTSADRFKEDKTLERLMGSASDRFFKQFFYLDPREEDDLLFTMNETERGILYVTTGDKEVKNVVLSRPIGYVAEKPKYHATAESALETFNEEIQPEVPLSYSMYTFLRLRHEIQSRFGVQPKDQFLDYLYGQIARENDINPDSAKRWK
ncbi:MAG: hypothetical protein ABIJ08_04355 [Nanoarchaeota archaeon]